MSAITIRNARLHNLKNIDLCIPTDKLVVVTGVSGSGKSSLVFDVLAEAGRRSYLQAIGILEEFGEDKGYDEIEGLLPAVAVKQGIIRQSNPRSVVGTRTRILPLLGSLFADEYNRQQAADETIGASFFSFNSPMGMCQQCQGRGQVFNIDFSVILPSHSTTLPEMFQNANMESSFRKYTNRLESRFGLDLSTPFQDFPELVQNLVLYGHDPEGRMLSGLDVNLKARLSRGMDINHAMTVDQCNTCQGYRLNKDALSVRLAGKHIGELSQLSIQQLNEFLLSLRDSLNKQAAESAGLRVQLLDQILGIVNQLVNVRLHYLTLDRPVPSLSGGEGQRLSLMSFLSSSMNSLLYIFDEPSTGLHELEKQDILDKINQLRLQGNSVIIVEHDSGIIEAAEHIIDVGPLAGDQGGQLVYQGSYTGLLASSQSITGQQLSHKNSRQLPAPRKAVDSSTDWLTVSDVRTNNLQSLTLKVPLGRMTGIAGVSGSGKSSLIIDTLAPAVNALLSHSNDRPATNSNANDNDDARLGLKNSLKDGLKVSLKVGLKVGLKDDAYDKTGNTDNLPCTTQALFGLCTGMEKIQRCIEIAQEPIGRRSDSNPVSYLGIWDRIRNCYAQQPLALERGYGAGHFSFNSKGACPHCNGSGKYQMWLGTTTVSYQCRECLGLRYQPEILDVLFEGNSIADTLNLSVSEAISLFSHDKPVSRMLAVLESTGMGYIKLGQASSTLSGGEAQRIKLARELGKRHSSKHTLFILDEPTTGLSLYDTSRLMTLLTELVEQDNTVIVIEHDPHVLSACDWLIELGPGGGHEGGELLAEGSVSFLREQPASLVGRFLDDD